jgi:hypothetical protein
MYIYLNLVLISVILSRIHLSFTSGLTCHPVVYFICDSGVDFSGTGNYSLYLYFGNLNFVVVPFSVAFEAVTVRVDSSY